MEKVWKKEKKTGKTIQRKFYIKSNNTPHDLKSNSLLTDSLESELCFFFFFFVFLCYFAATCHSTVVCFEVEGVKCLGWIGILKFLEHEKFTKKNYNSSTELLETF